MRKYKLKAAAHNETALCRKRSGEMVNAFCAKVCISIKQVNTWGHTVSTCDAKVQVESSCTQWDRFVLQEIRLFIIHAKEKWWMSFVLKCASTLCNWTQQDTQLVLLMLKFELKATAYNKTTLCCKRSDYTHKGEMVNVFCAKVCISIKQLNTARHTVSASGARVWIESNCIQWDHFVLRKIRLYTQRRNGECLLC